MGILSRRKSQGNKQETRDTCSEILQLDDLSPSSMKNLFDEKLTH